MITIKEIAEQLGVSPTTVSNVINGKTNRMSPKTRQRVEEALVFNHYVSEEKSDAGDSEPKFITMNFFMGDREHILTDPFCGELLEAVEKKLRQYNRCVVCNVVLEEERILKLLSARNIEGGIVLGYPPEKCSSLQKRSLKPLIFVDSGEGDYDNIGLQDYMGACEITNYLIQQGHRRIAFFCDEKEPLASNAERYRGFLRAMEQASLLFHKEDYYYLPFEKNLRYEILRQFATKVREERYTAAMFSYDLLANEAITTLFSQGVVIPEQLSVVGFDDNIYARLSRPALTTVRQSPTEKGNEAVKLLMKRIYGEEVLVHCLQLPTELIVRESVKNVVK
ncbi:MAG: LacI family DNA-binding transcriptional regulator [bacterium]|nr:LacI family DNA-binding transcriptional regulator [bacterium]